MKRRRASAAGVIVIAVLTLAAIGVSTGASGGPDSTSHHLTYGNSLTRIRARNLRLQSMIALLRERRLRGAAGGSPSLGEPAQSTQISSRNSGSPAPKPAAAETSECDPNYEGACLNPNASDYDCEGGDGNGPYYTGEVRVVGVDHFGLDADGDGIGCERE